MLNMFIIPCADWRSRSATFSHRMWAVVVAGLLLLTNVNIGVNANTAACFNFTVGNADKSELYSPSYPNRYTNHTDCTRIITAGPSQVIRLYFHEFHMETSDQSCKYDWLEVRDGPFGYSPLLGRYCGGKSPLILISTSRYMWLAFHSDDTVEGGGFRIAYQFLMNNEPEVPDPDVNQPPVCLMDVRLDNVTSLYVKSEDILPTSKTHSAIDCTWNISAPPAHLLYIVFTELKTQRQCGEASVEVYERNTMFMSRQRQYCESSTAAMDFKSSDSRIFVRMRAASLSRQPAFTALVTVFQPGVLVGLVGKCPNSLFHCGNNDCISPLLLCNGVQNCLSGLDETQCDTTTSPSPTTAAPMTTAELSVHIVTIISVACVIILFALISFIVTCQHMARERAARRERQRMIPEELAFKRSTASVQMQETTRLMDNTLLELPPPPSRDKTALPRRQLTGATAVAVSFDDYDDDDSETALATGKHRRKVPNNVNGPTRRIDQEIPDADDSSSVMLQSPSALLALPPPDYRDAVDCDSSPNLSLHNELLSVEAVIEHTVAPPSPVPLPPPSPLPLPPPPPPPPSPPPSVDYCHQTFSNGSVNHNQLAPADVKLNRTSSAITTVPLGQHNTQTIIPIPTIHTSNNGSRPTKPAHTPQFVDGNGTTQHANGSEASKNNKQQHPSRSSSKSPSRVHKALPQKSPQPSIIGEQTKLNGKSVKSLVPVRPPADGHQQRALPLPMPQQAMAPAALLLKVSQSKIGLRCANHTLINPHECVHGQRLGNGSYFYGNGDMARLAAGVRPIHGTRHRDLAHSLRRTQSVESVLSETSDIWKPVHLLMNGHAAEGEGEGHSLTSSSTTTTLNRLQQQPHLSSAQPPLISPSPSQRPPARKRHVTLTNGGTSYDSNAHSSDINKQSLFAPLLYSQPPKRSVSLEVDV